ncbi:hypothetical protein [Rubritepida flocculans]|uniref:hypothetical protein n=1 Tax=Rubritepida flocculans TaxID=182403 RepID=UPI00040F9851|nr:hypothetical protein [Rubritepida flocculans]
MDPYFLSLVCLGIAGMIEARCSTPGLRPEYEPADRAFRFLGRSAFAMWLALLVFGFWKFPWWQPLAGLLGSLAANALVLQFGARPYWPGMSMGLALLGLGLASKVLFEAF